MIYLILAGLVLVLIVVVNLARAEPMPQDQEDEDERLDRQEQVRLDVRWSEVQAGYRPRAAMDRFKDTEGSL